jgi:hypothetical protein
MHDGGGGGARRRRIGARWRLRYAQFQLRTNRCEQTGLLLVCEMDRDVYFLIVETQTLNDECVTLCCVVGTLNRHACRIGWCQFRNNIGIPGEDVNRFYFLMIPTTTTTKIIRLPAVRTAFKHYSSAGAK